MIWLFLYSLNDALDNSTVIHFNATNSNQQAVFPAISLCIKYYKDKKTNIEKLKAFIQNYYAEHDIEVPFYSGDYDFYHEVVNILYISQRAFDYKKLKPICNSLNSTCGMDFKIMKPMVKPFWFI